MRQLTGMDAQFLTMDSRRGVGHVTSVNIVDPSTAGHPINGDSVRAYLAERLHLIPQLSWRLVEVPLGIDQPYWVEEPDLDLGFHVRSIALPAPGSDRQLADQVSRIATRSLDRNRPLWEVYVIEGLEGGRVALLFKLHHAAFDGQASVNLLASLFVPDPTKGPPPSPPAKEVAPVPSSREMLAKGVRGVLKRPEKGLRYMVEAAQAGGRLAGQLGLNIEDWKRMLTLPARPPRVSFNATLSEHRNWAFGSVPLQELKAVKRAAGVTVNDVVMAMCAGALRQYLIDHNELPDRPLLAMVPVSTRTAATAGSGGNEVSMMIAAIPTNLADPLERLAAAHESMRAAKEQFAAVPANLLTDLTEFTAPAASQLVADTMLKVGWAERILAPFNLVISNVPGPDISLYFDGALLVEGYPLSLIYDGVGLNITLTSMRGLLTYGVVGTPELVPDNWDLITYLGDELNTLAAAVGVAAS